MSLLRNGAKTNGGQMPKANEWTFMSFNALPYVATRIHMCLCGCFTFFLVVCIVLNTFFHSLNTFFHSLFHAIFALLCVGVAKNIHSILILLLSINASSWEKYLNILLRISGSGIIRR